METPGLSLPVDTAFFELDGAFDILIYSMCAVSAIREDGKPATSFERDGDVVFTGAAAGWTNRNGPAGVLL